MSSHTKVCTTSYGGMQSLYHCGSVTPLWWKALEQGMLGKLQVDYNTREHKVVKFSPKRRRPKENVVNAYEGEYAVKVSF